LSVGSDAERAAIDRPTVYAIGAISYFAAVLIHEGLGHAGTTMLLGGRVVQITSAACTCDVSALTPWAARTVYAGGCIANVLTGMLVLTLERLVPTTRSTLRYACWLFGHVSLLIATGYLMVFPFLPAGDWHDFVAGLPNVLAWQLGLTLIGIVGYVATMQHAQHGLDVFGGSDPRERAVRARVLTLGPYLVGGILETLSAVVGGGGILALISAAPATFGGTIGLPIVGRRMSSARGTSAAHGMTLSRSRGVLVFGWVAAIVQLFWLGPGLLRNH